MDHVATAMTVLPRGDGTYHHLRQGDTTAAFHWDATARKWSRGGKSWRPEALAAEGWSYDRPNRPAAPPPEPEPELTEADFILNPAGKPVARRALPPARVLEHDTTAYLCELARQMQKALAEFRAQAFGDVRAYQAEMAAQFGVHLGGSRGGGRLETFDQRSRVSVSIADIKTFGTELQAAKVLIDACLTEWSEKAPPELRQIVEGAFEVGTNGTLNNEKILDLRNYNIDDPRWKRAMEIINLAHRPVDSRSYIRFYERADADSDWKLIPLSLSGS